jgi:hypothetical protein
MRAIAYASLGLGGAVCVLNFYLSFLRYPVHALRGKADEYRWVSGLPLLGSALVVLSLSLVQLPIWALVIGVIVAALDTGGMHWFVGVLAWQALRQRS